MIKVLTSSSKSWKIYILHFDMHLFISPTTCSWIYEVLLFDVCTDFLLISLFFCFAWSGFPSSQIGWVCILREPLDEKCKDVWCEGWFTQRLEIRQPTRKMIYFGTEIIRKVDLGGFGNTCLEKTHMGEQKKCVQAVCATFVYTESWRRFIKA